MSSFYQYLIQRYMHYLHFHRKKESARDEAWSATPKTELGADVAQI